jgi:cob(I)alamin adenosyltransferase
MKLYTKIGDQGHTQFFGCGLVEKDDPRIEALGALDELNSVIGVTLCFIEDAKLRELLTKTQNDLFQVGADLVGSKLEENTVPRIQENHITDLEQAIDVLQEKLGIPQKFILPGGTIASSFIHLCRATTRRAERSLVTASKTIRINSTVLRYVNRLSDFLFILARDANKELNVKEQQPIYKYFNNENETGNI